MSSQLPAADGANTGAGALSVSWANWEGDGFDGFPPDWDEGSEAEGLTHAGELPWQAHPHEEA